MLLSATAALLTISLFLATIHTSHAACVLPANAGGFDLSSLDANDVSVSTTAFSPSNFPFNSTLLWRPCSPISNQYCSGIAQLSSCIVSSGIGFNAGNAIVGVARPFFAPQFVNNVVTFVYTQGVTGLCYDSGTVGSTYSLVVSLACGSNRVANVTRVSPCLYVMLIYTPLVCTAPPPVQVCGVSDVKSGSVNYSPMSQTDLATSSSSGQVIAHLCGAIATNSLCNFLGAAVCSVSNTGILALAFPGPYTYTNWSVLFGLQRGLILTYLNTTACSSNPQRNYAVSVNLTCSVNAPFPFANNSISLAPNNGDTCSYQLRVLTPLVCTSAPPQPPTPVVCGLPPSNIGVNVTQLGGLEFFAAVQSTNTTTRIDASLCNVVSNERVCAALGAAVCVITSSAVNVIAFPGAYSYRQLNATNNTALAGLQVSYGNTTRCNDLPQLMNQVDFNFVCNRTAWNPFATFQATKTGVCSFLLSVQTTSTCNVQATDSSMSSDVKKSLDKLMQDIMSPGFAKFLPKPQAAPPALAAL